MTMIERVARAMMIHAEGNLGGWSRFHHVYKKEARAAIEAMREPTQEMCDAAGDSYELGQSTSACRTIWVVMIDEALEDKVVASRGEA